MVTKVCDWCKKESNAYFAFLKPQGWIKHRTHGQTDMLFCSLTCFRAFTSAELSARSKRTVRPIEAQEEQLLATLAR